MAWLVALRTEVETLRAQNAELRAQVEQWQLKYAALESTLINLAAENALLKRRLFGAKSERRGTEELQLTFDGMLDPQKAIQSALDAASSEDGVPSKPSSTPPDNPPTKSKPTGRRNLLESSVPRIVVEIRDRELEEQGRARFIRWETSTQLLREASVFKVLVKRTAQYEVTVANETTVVTAEPPPQLFPKAMLHTSMLAWLAVQKFGLGVPHYRLEQSLALYDVGLDRGTMSRNMEAVGNTLGATIVYAMMQDAMTNCTVLATDATGASIQPAKEPKDKKKGNKAKLRSSCLKGHFFTIVADRAHVLYVYTPKHNQAFVAEQFRDFRGLLQSDGSSVYDVLNHGPPSASGTDPPIRLVGCWAHCRRYFFEAAICREPLGLEGLSRIGKIYDVDRKLQTLKPDERYRHRQTFVAPLIQSFFEWVDRHHDANGPRSVLKSAFVYARNQQRELERVLLDGRLALDNNRSERALRTIVVGRKNWLFYGGKEHAEAAAAIFSILASCRLHSIEPQQYLDEVMRLLPTWPKQRHIELAPLHWKQTRSRLNADQLASPVAQVDIPEPIRAYEI